MKKVGFMTLVIMAFIALLASNSVSATQDGTLQNISFSGDFGEQDEVKEKSSDVEVLVGDKKQIINKELIEQKSTLSKGTLAQKSAGIQATNDSPNTAGGIEIGNVYTDTISAEGQAKWFTFNNDTQGKLSVIMQTVPSEDINYDLHLFKLNEETMTLEEELISSYGPGKNEQLSKISEPGTYFVAVNSVTGYDEATPFALLVQKSSNYDQSEPDDNIWQAPGYLNNVYTQQTIDNAYDMDWVLLQVDEGKTLSLNLNNPTGIEYQIDIFDTALNPLTGLDDNTHYNIDFGAGTYLLRVQSTSVDFDPNQSYTLDIREAAGPATDVVITDVDTDDNVEGYLDYGYGDMYRIEHFMNISGQIFDENGISVPNTSVEVHFTTALNDEVYTETGVTDRDGNFTIGFSDINEAVGNYGYDNYSSYHYFDIIPLVVSSNGEILNSNEDSLYHFAYSIYQPH